MNIKELKEMNLLFQIRRKDIKEQEVYYTAGLKKFKFKVIFQDTEERYTLLKPDKFIFNGVKDGVYQVTVYASPSKIKLSTELRSDGLNILEFKNAKKYYIFGINALRLNNIIRTSSKEYRVVSNYYKTISKDNPAYMKIIYENLSEKLKLTKDIKTFLRGSEVA